MIRTRLQGDTPFFPNMLNNGNIEVCLKEDVDKVIAELKDKLDLYKRGWEENDKVNENLYAQLRHHKYKRCLAMRDYCLCELEFAFRDTCVERSVKGCVRWRKWVNRWRELAEKFKEAK